jgi:hypothetical protein
MIFLRWGLRNRRLSVGMAASRYIGLRELGISSPVSTTVAARQVFPANLKSSFHNLEMDFVAPTVTMSGISKK